MPNWMHILKHKRAPLVVYNSALLFENEWLNEVLAARKGDSRVEPHICQLCLSSQVLPFRAPFSILIWYPCGGIQKHKDPKLLFVSRPYTRLKLSKDQEVSMSWLQPSFIFMRVFIRTTEGKKNQNKCLVSAFYRVWIFPRFSPPLSHEKCQNLVKIAHNAVVFIFISL